MRALPVSLVFVAATVLVITATRAAADTPVKHRSCSREIDWGTQRYRLGRLPPAVVREGAKLGVRGRFQCEPALVCRARGGCALSRGRVFSRDVLHRIRGIKPFLAVIDDGRIFVNRAIFTVAEPGKALLRALRRGGGPQRDYSQAPPKSLLLASTTASVRLAWGDFCWTSPSGNGSVTACVEGVAPSQRFDLPLILAEPGATLQVRLGFVPSSVEVALLNRAGAVVYAHTLTSARAINWTIPENIPVSSFIEITAGRPGFPQDSAAYLARLREPS